MWLITSVHQPTTATRYLDTSTAQVVHIASAAKSAALTTTVLITSHHQEEEREEREEEERKEEEEEEEDMQIQKVTRDHQKRCLNMTRSHQLNYQHLYEH